MKTNHHGIFKRGFALLELLLVAAIIMSLCYFTLKVYFKSSPVDKSTQKALLEQGIDASSRRAVLESTRSRIKDINKQVLDREKQILEDWTHN